MSIKNNILELGINAKKASAEMKLCNNDQKNTALLNLIKNISLNLNKFLFFKKRNNNTELNHDEIDVAIGIIIKPMLLK